MSSVSQYCAEQLKLDKARAAFKIKKIRGFQYLSPLSVFPEPFLLTLLKGFGPKGVPQARTKIGPKYKGNGLNSDLILVLTFQPINHFGNSFRS